MLVRPVIAVGAIAVNADMSTLPAAFADTTMIPGSGPFFGFAVIVAPGTVMSALGRPPGVVTVAPTGAPQTAAVAAGFGAAWIMIATQAGFAPVAPKAGWWQGGTPAAPPARAHTVAFAPV